MSSYSLGQAATVCQVSARTIQRKLGGLEQAGAWKDAAGHWHIPVVAMAAVGLSPGRPAAPDTTGDMTPDMSLRQRDSVYDSDDDTVAQLRAEVAEWRRRAEVAEVHATERERVIEAQAVTLKMLEAKPTPPVAGTAEATRAGHASHRPQSAMSVKIGRGWRRLTANTR